MASELKRFELLRKMHDNQAFVLSACKKIRKRARDIMHATNAARKIERWGLRYRAVGETFSYFLILRSESDSAKLH
jgi:hypothetical protein